MSNTDNQGSSEKLDSGRFYNYTMELIKSDFFHESEILLLLGMKENFIQKAAGIGSSYSSSLILSGEDGHSARDKGFEEINSWIKHNIDTYCES